MSQTRNSQVQCYNIVPCKFYQQSQLCPRVAHPLNQNPRLLFSLPGHPQTYFDRKICTIPRKQYFLEYFEYKNQDLPIYSTVSHTTKQ